MIYTVKPKGGTWDTRHRLAAERAGFRWERNCYLFEAEDRPTVWGCKVQIYVPPRPTGMWKVVGEILDGTREF